MHSAGLRQAFGAIFFAPADALMNRLGISAKFTLLGLMSLVAIAVVIYGLFDSLHQVIRTSQRQLQGIALIKPFSRAIQLMQQHRGLSNGLLSGNEEMRQTRLDKGREVIAALRAMEQQLPSGIASSAEFQELKANFERIQAFGLDWPVDESFAAHTQLIAKMLSFSVATADEYELTHAPEIGAFYLIDTTINKLPNALEHLGQLRAYGTGILARRQATEQQKVEMNTLVAELGHSLRQLGLNLDKTARYNPAIQSSLASASRDVTDSAQQVMALVASDIVSGRFITSPDAFFGMATAAIDKGYAQLYESLVPMSQTLIEARIARAEDILRTSVGIALLLFVVVVYFSLGISRGIVGNVRSLARSARAFAAGDLQERVQLDTRDEFSRVGDSFNEMADGFNTMLAARQEDEARLRTTIDTAMDAVVRMNSEGLVSGWNKQAEKIFGWSREEALGRMMSETIIPLQYRAAHEQGLKRLLLSGEGPVLNSRIEITGLHRDGREFPIELAIASSKLAGKYEFSAFIRDITERKSAEEQLDRHRNHLEELVASRTVQLAEARQIAEAANLAKSSFLANMSHEIRTPMNAIVGFANLMRRDGVTPRQADRLDKIDRATQHLLGIINDILDLSKIEAGKLVLDHSDMAIDSIAANVASMLFDQAQAKGIKLVADIEPIRDRVIGDPIRLQQALLNYASNAVKFTERGSVTLRSRMVSAAENEVQVRFEVEDTGIGIAPDALGRLFNVFEQEDNSTTRRFGGTGLGLAITRRLVELMGGEVGVQSSPGQGSRFWFTVPLKKAGTAADGEEFASAEEVEARLARICKGVQVLVADDDVLNREVALGLLTDIGFAVDTASDGAEALQMATTNSYAMILMDMQMPNLDGLEAARRIRMNPQCAAVPILAMTANTFGEDKELCLAAGMNDFISKPFTPGGLFTPMLHWLVTDEERAARRRGSALKRQDDILAPETSALQQIDGSLQEIVARMDALLFDNDVAARRLLHEHAALLGRVMGSKALAVLERQIAGFEFDAARTTLDTLRGRATVAIQHGN